MKTTQLQHAPISEGPPSDQAEAEGKDWSYGDAFQGIEFLDDSIRMEDHSAETLAELKLSSDGFHPLLP